MTENELRNLQYYIGKRNKNQTDEQVIDHINEINDKTPLTQEEWHKLIFPSCNNGYIVILRYILNHIQSLKDIKTYMVHTVNGRNERLISKRIEVLNEFIQYLKENKIECLSETMLSAAWFGETEIVKFLIENGADREYKKQNGLGLSECAERAEKTFQDSSLKEYLVQL